MDPAEADLTPMDPTRNHRGGGGWRWCRAASAPRCPDDAGSPREESAVVVVSARRGNPAARGGYAPVQPYGESVNYENRLRVSLEGPHARLSATYSVPTDLLGIIAEVRRRWRMKLALRGVVRVARDACGLLPHRGVCLMSGIGSRAVLDRRWRAWPWPSRWRVR